MSLLRESHDDLQKHLVKRSRSGNQLEDIELLTSAVLWPNGFRQLIAHGITSNDVNQAGYSILDMALSGPAALGVIQYLLGLSMSFITPHTWESANRFHEEKFDTESIEILQCIAAQLAECRQNCRLVLTNESTFPAIGTMYHTLYHVDNLSVVGAQALYDNGFTQIDYNEEKLNVPLLFHMKNVYHCLQKQLDLIQWFYNKTRSLNISYPGSNINASQVMVGVFIQQSLSSKTMIKTMYDLEEFLLEVSQYRSMLADAFSDPHQDYCTCFCSANGCDVMTIALKKCQSGYGRLESFILKVFSLLRINLEEHPELLQSALRVKTFDRLGMTHTCASSHHTYWYREFPEHERSEIHRMEKNDIGILETLLTHFESEWSNYSGTFLEFLDSNWEPHMESVLAERRAIPIDREVLDDHGIKLVEYGPEEIPEPQSPDDKYEITWFQRVAEAIVDGREINKEDQWLMF